MIKIELQEWQVKNLRNYFGENDKTQTSHWAYEVFNKALKKQCDIPVVVQVKPKKVCELIRQKFDDWVFGLETQAGEKLKVVDSTDFNEIITEIENELKDLQNL